MEAFEAILARLLDLHVRLLGLGLRGAYGFGVNCCYNCTINPKPSCFNLAK